MTDLEIYDQARAGFRTALRVILTTHVPNGLTHATLWDLTMLIQDLEKLAALPVLEDVSPKTAPAQKRSASEI